VSGTEYEPTLPQPSLSKRYTVALDTARRIARGRYGGWSIADREDLVSEVMIKYWIAFGADGGPDTPRGWLSNVIQRTAIDMHRAQVRRPAFPKGDMSPAENWLDGWLGAVEHVGPGKRVASRELIAQVLGLVNGEERELLTLMYLDRRSTAEIAQMSGKSVHAISQAVHRAKIRLIAALTANADLLEELRAPMPRLY
jgi:RNA polymerase sigma factor (sigma-70 family)